MDRGELFNCTFTVCPCQDETFSVVHYEKRWGFTSVDDLMKFLVDHADGWKSRKSADYTASELKEMEICKS